VNDLSHARGRRLRAFSISDVHVTELGRSPDPKSEYAFCLVGGEYRKPPSDMQPVVSWPEPRNRRYVILYEHPAFEPYDEKNPAPPLPLFEDRTDLKRVAPPLVPAPAPAEPYLGTARPAYAGPAAEPKVEPDRAQFEEALRRARSAQWLSIPPPAIDMLLWCPTCHAQHIDKPEPHANWTNPPHRSHKCHACGTIWRPADVPTNGVAAIATRGEADTFRPLTAEEAAVAEALFHRPTLEDADE